MKNENISIMAEEEVLKIEKGTTAIKSYEFKGRKMKEIKFPEGLTSIGYCSFCDCTELKRVNIPESVVKIEDEAFAGCTQLTDVIIPQSVREMKNVFKDCPNLVMIKVPLHLVPTIVKETKGKVLVLAH